MAWVCVVVDVATPCVSVMAFSSAVGSFEAVGILRMHYVVIFLGGQDAIWRWLRSRPRLAIGHVLAALLQLVALCPAAPAANFALSRVSLAVACALVL